MTPVIGQAAPLLRTLRRAATDLGVLSVPVPRDEPHVVRVERSLMVPRWLAIVIVALAAPFVPLTATELVTTYTVVALGLLYTLVLQLVVIRRHPDWLSGGYLTSLAEVSLVSLVVYASGGGNSPLFLAYFIVVVAAAERPGLHAALITASISIALFTLVAALPPGSSVPPTGELLLRFGFLGLTGLLAGYLAREAYKSRQALVTELVRTRALHRASVALAEENAELSARLQKRLHELEQTQAQLIQSAKLATIGKLAANVAHEISNPLTAVLTTVELLQEDFAGDDAQRADLRTIREEVLRARAIMRNLLDFARQTPATLELTDPRHILEAVIPLTQKRAALAGVELQQAHPAEPLPIVVDVGQFKQVLVNLLTNAIDAMPSGGVVCVATGRRGDEVVLTVRDTGPGILPEHRDRIFEPFFTTKPAVSGTGLGLPVSYGIVERHGGKITVESAPGAGATFTVHLPIAASPPAGGAARDASPRAGNGSS